MCVEDLGVFTDEAEEAELVTVTSKARSVPSNRSVGSSFVWMALLPPIYISWRVWWSNRLPIMDCDEVYNYWEPLHYLMYGTGFQTWEYAHQYGLRTYAYLYPLSSYGMFLQDTVLPFLNAIFPQWVSLLVDTTIDTAHTQYDHPISHDRLAVFVLLRASLAAFMAISELAFLFALDNYLACRNASNTSASQRKDGSSSAATISTLTAVFMLSAAGMCHMSGALLPSTTMTICWLQAMAAFLRFRHRIFVFWAVLATLAIGWPFGVVLFVPCGIAVLYREYFAIRDAFSGPTLSGIISGPYEIIKILFQTLLITMVVQATVIYCDFQEYGVPISPVWNIFQYNTSHGGDELYGIEPWTYYLKNLLLNFNIVALLGIIAIPLWIIVTPFTALFGFMASSKFSTKDGSGGLIVMLSALYVWLVAVFPRPHKEERFLFPIYPCLCLGAAWVTTQLLAMATTSVPKSSSKKTTSTVSMVIIALVAGPATLLSLSRTIALSKYYTAPLSIYAQLGRHVVEHQDKNEDSEETILACTCGEWYRFPSSFYLPPNVRLGFRPSSFQGQLPRQFTVHGSGPRSMSVTDGHFNDHNLLTPGSFVASEEACNYMIDLWDSNTCRENDSLWRPITQVPFLDASQTSTLHRMLYIPFVHEIAERATEQQDSGVKYTEYVLFGREEQAQQAETEHSDADGVLGSEPPGPSP